MEPHFKSYKEAAAVETYAQAEEAETQTMPSELGRALNCGKGLPFVVHSAFKMETIQARTRSLF